MLRATGNLQSRWAIVQIGVQAFNYEGLGFASGDPVHPCRALIDTGAHRTALALSFISAIGLRPSGKVDVVTVGHEARHRTYLVNLTINAESDVGNPTPYALDEPITVMHMQDNIHFEAILGMDVLSKFDLVVRRNGSFFVQLNPPLVL